ncbi:MAG: amino acid ABC transporter permease [Dermatophilaceae bacterium]
MLQPSTARPVRNVGQWVATATTLFVGFLMARSLIVNPNMDWKVVGQYQFNHIVLGGLWQTLLLTFGSMAIGLGLGLVIALMRVAKNRVLNAIAGLYIWFFRGTPLLVQLLLWFNLALLFPTLSFGIPFGPTFFSAPTNSVISAFAAALLALGLNEAAYMAEIVRAGFQSVDQGQHEAARALGMSHSLTMRIAVLPQSMRVIVPPTGNQVISMLKTTSLVYVISGNELLTRVQQIYAVNFKVIPMLIVASLWYLVLTTIASIIQHYVEQFYNRGTATSARLPISRRVRQNLSMFQPRGGG